MEQSEENSKLSSGRLSSPFVEDNNRFGGDMIVLVEIIAGRLMRNAFTRKGLQLVIKNVRKTRAYLLGL